MRSFATYVIIIALSAILVVNPVVIYLLTGLRGFAAYVLLFDLWLGLAILGAALYLKRQRRGYLWLSIACLVTLAPVLAAGEIAYVLLRQQYGDRLLGEIPAIYEPDPWLVYTHLPDVVGQHVSHGNFDVQYVTDDLGRKKIGQSAGARYTLHVFGDSFTFGFGVANSDTWLNLLADQLGGEVNVLNYGVVGYSLEQMFLSLREHLGEVQAGDHVVFAPVAADLERGPAGRWYVCGGLIRAERNEAFPKFEDGEWSLVRLRDECDFLLDTALANSPFPLGFGALYRSLQRRAIERAVIANAERIFAEAERLVGERGARFQVVFLATPEECRSGTFTLALDQLKTPHRSLMPYCPDDPDAAQGLQFPHDGHWNVEGHEWAADALRAVLEGKQAP